MNLGGESQSSVWLPIRLYCPLHNCSSLQILVCKLRTVPSIISAFSQPSSSFSCLPGHYTTGFHTGTCQPLTITAIKGLPLLGSSSCWEEPAEGR